MSSDTKSSSESASIVYGRQGWSQTTVTLKRKSRGCHLVTEEVVAAIPQLSKFKIGMATFFIKHTSCSITLNENWDSDVRTDMETALNILVPENKMPFKHTMEGPDDMPAHVR
jgi:secondary thiamine-phosphate synthase enzyme